MKLTHKKAKGFTLVELLVVIAIIAVLATLASPAIMKALQKAKIVKAEGVCTAFETAVVNFEGEYNYLPYGGGSGSTAPTVDEEVRSDDDVVGVLAGVEDQLNFKQIRFFSQNDPKGSGEDSYRDGMKLTDTSAKLYDPWGELYYIIIDYDLDGEIDNPLKLGKTIGGKKCAVYSTGPDKEKGTTGTNTDNPANF